MLHDRGFRGLASLLPEMLRATRVDAAARRAGVVTSDQMRVAVEVFGDTAY